MNILNQTISMNVGGEICDCLTLGDGSETDGLLSGSELTITGIILTLNFSGRPTVGTCFLNPALNVDRCLVRS
jgi:hypothetical protein